jgi:copper ion binding protein
MSTNNSSSKTASIGFLAAITTSRCCITPVFSVLVGVGGIASTFFTWMEPLRPYLIGLTVAVLAFAWYQKLKPRTQEEIDCACEEDKKPSFWQSKRFLRIVTVFAALMLAFPSYSHIFYPDSKSSGPILANQDSEIKMAEFKIKGMTCTGCEEHIKYATAGLEGVLETKASHTEASAQVKFNANAVSLEAITEAINMTGYTVTETKVSNWNAEKILFQPATFNTIELSVKGMTCSGCETHVTNAIGKLEGVDSVKVSYEKANAVVKYDAKKVRKDQIVEAINKTGYSVIEKTKEN